MRLITIFELANLTDAELDALRRYAAGELARSVPGSQDRSRALASLENIARVRGSRRLPPKP